MNNIKLWIAVLIIAVISVLGLFNPISKVSYPIQQKVGDIGQTTNFTRIGLGIKDAYVQTTADRQSLVTSTTTPCSILSPNATTSITFADLNITTGTSTATYWQIATSTNQYATTSPFATFTVASGATPALIYNGNTGVDTVVAPNTWINWKVGGTVISDATKLLGTCQVELIGI